MASRPVEGIVDELIHLVDVQDLLGRATRSVQARGVEAEDEDVDWAFTADEIQTEFGAQMLCFRSGSMNAEAPYIATTLQFYAFEYHVGWYELLTTLDGKVIQEDTIIFDDYFADGRAAPLIDKARDRVGNNREWVGLVGLKPMPSATFFPEWAVGGFTTAVALAPNEDDYRREVERFFADQWAKVEEMEDVEPLADRLR